MTVFHNLDDLKKVSSKYIFIDNDALSDITSTTEVFKEFRQLLESGYPMLDPLTVFEYRRDMYDPKLRKPREAILTSGYFQIAIHNHEIFKVIQRNALILSLIYSQQNRSGGHSWSPIDLLLAARIMYFRKRSVLITGNKSDFPSTIFDTLGTMNIEDKNGKMKVLSILQFSENKFALGYEALIKLNSEPKK